MTTSAHPVAPRAQAASRMLGERMAVVSSGAWFSAVSSATFADAAAEAHDAGARDLVLDLTNVHAVDAAGTTTLAALAEQLDTIGCEVAFAATHPGIVEWLTMGPLDISVAVHGSVEDALGDLLRRPV